MGNRFHRGELLLSIPHKDQLFLTLGRADCSAEGRLELGVALGFSMGGAPRWRLLPTFS